jgi:hypothetical protein
LAALDFLVFTAITGVKLNAKKARPQGFNSGCFAPA